MFPADISKNDKISRWRQIDENLHGCFSATRRVQNKSLLFPTCHYTSILQICSEYSKTLQLWRSSGNTHTHTHTRRLVDYYNQLRLRARVNKSAFVVRPRTTPISHTHFISDGLKLKQLWLQVSFWNNIQYIVYVYVLFSLQDIKNTNF